MRRLTVVVLAVAVPIGWSLAFLQTPREWPLTVAMVVTSVLFWSNAAGFLARSRSLATRVGAGVLLGAASPFLCAALMTVVLIPFWPVFLVYAGNLLAVPFVLPLFVLHEWQAFVPVGAGTGLIVALLAGGPPAAARYPASAAA